MLNENLRLVAFDLDGTLAPSKSPIPDQIAEMLQSLMSTYEVCIISGGKYEQFQQQVLSKIQSPYMWSLHLMPTCGTKYYKYSKSKKDWVNIYSEDLSNEQAVKIMKAMDLAGHLYRDKTPTVWGPQIEDRGSQITFSALGQEAPVEEKEKWDPTGIYRRELKSMIECHIEPEEFQVSVGGSTSIDVTKVGIDKAFGMDKLMDLLNVSLDEVLFYGDKLKPGGNDFPVRAMGVKCVEVSGWQDTLQHVGEEIEL